MLRWESWSGLTTARPAQVLSPSSTAEVVDAVVAARRHGLTVKMVGSGHSFTDIARADGLLLRPDRLVGVRTVDRDAMTVTVLAGTPLHVLDDRLLGLGLALHNLGDIDRQTVAGAISTGTHGTGGRWASLSAQVAGFELVTADARVVQARPTGTAEEVELLDAGRVGLGALGILTAVTFRVEPAFTLEAVEEPMPLGPVRRRVRRPGRGQRARRGLLVPAHRPDADQAQQPARAARPGRCRGPGPTSRTSCWPTRCSGR